MYVYLWTEWRVGGFGGEEAEKVRSLLCGQKRKWGRVIPKACEHRVRGLLAMEGGGAATMRHVGAGVA